jgi:SAM-dependent methyltransferase
MVPMNVDVSSAAVDAGRSDSDDAMAIAASRSERKRDLVLNRARAEMIRRLVGELKPALNLANALDVGCGTGSGAQAMQGCGLYVRGFDARMKNIIAARERFPRIPFGQAEVEDPDIARLGTFDLVLCLGLLHRLENPMLAIRHMRALSGKGLLLESMCLPDAEAGMATLSRLGGCTGPASAAANSTVRRRPCSGVSRKSSCSSRPDSGGSAGRADEAVGICGERNHPVFGVGEISVVRFGRRRRSASDVERFGVLRCESGGAAEGARRGIQRDGLRAAIDE